METAGCFGKLPQLGDFVISGLPRRFIDPWDGFLREFLASSRDALGDAWLDTYLNGPIWRFALGAGLAGPNAVVGILMPSVDRVGRYFPLTIAQLVDKVPAALGEDPWFDRAEMLSLDALADEFDPKTFSARLEELGAPDCSSETHGDSGGRWWTLGARALPPLGLCASALPRGQAGTTLLDGDWERWGWDAQPIPFKADSDATATEAAPHD
jgi:type VI secretion system protein ImpM